MAEKKNENTTLVNFRIDPAVKESAEAVLAGMGLNVSAYVGMCLRQLAQDRQIPFTPTVNADFWMAENAVSEAMRIIDSGLFKKAYEKKEAMQGEWGQMLLSMYGNDYFYYLAYTSGVKVAETFENLGQLPALLKNEEDSEDKVAFLEFLKTAENWIATQCRTFLENEGWEIADNDIGIVKEFDRVLCYPVAVYEKYPSNFSLRFAGVGADMESYEKVADLSEKMAKTEEELKNRTTRPERRQSQKNDSQGIDWAAMLSSLNGSEGEE